MRMSISVSCCGTRIWLRFDKGKRTDTQYSSVSLHVNPSEVEEDPRLRLNLIEMRFASELPFPEYFASLAFIALG